MILREALWQLKKEWALNYGDWQWEIATEVLVSSLEWINQGIFVLLDNVWNP